MMARLQEVTPALSTREATHWRDAEQRELLLSGLRLAAGETAQSS
jgi:hypothetical protein